MKKLITVICLFLISTITYSQSFRLFEISLGETKQTVINRLNNEGKTISKIETSIKTLDRIKVDNYKMGDTDWYLAIDFYKNKVHRIFAFHIRATIVADQILEMAGLFGTIVKQLRSIYGTPFKLDTTINPPFNNSSPFADAFIAGAIKPLAVWKTNSNLICLSMRMSKDIAAIDAEYITEEYNNYLINEEKKQIKNNF